MRHIAGPAPRSLRRTDRSLDRSTVAPLIVGAALLLGCGNVTADPPVISSTTADTATAPSPTTSTTGAAQPHLTNSADTPLPTIGSDVQFTATADDVEWSRLDSPFDPEWDDEEVAEWRRSVFLEGRFDAIHFLAGLDAFDEEATMTLDGMSPPYEDVLEYVADIHNNAEQVVVTNEDGSEEFLSVWFAIYDAKTRGYYETTVELRAAMDG